MKEARLPLVAWVLLVVLTVVYLGWGLGPELALYSEWLTPRVMLALAAVTKLAYLLGGALLAFACRDRLDAGNPARPAWALLSVGLLATFAGQLSLAPFQIVEGRTPFPSVGDLYYVLSYPFLIASFLVFLRAYRESGFPIGSLVERLAIVIGIGLFGGTLAVRVLRPIAASGSELLDRILNVAYPLLDLVLLIPLALLLRMALRMRGSHVGAIWALLLGGYVFLICGDVAFAYLTEVGQQHLDPFLHATYILSYGLIAAGAHRQLLLLKS
jgi:hypothetical protein